MTETRRATPTRSCRACGHIERATIDGALSVGMSPRSIVRRYAGLSRKAVQGHRDRCLAEAGGRGPSYEPL